MTPKHILFPLAWLATLSNAQASPNKVKKDARPNVIIIYADDLGYGDLSCYGMERVETPNIDKLAASGLRFTHAHTSSATSTPSRYSMLTGSYAWRTPGTGVAAGDAAMIIKPSTTTIADQFRSAGYTTAAIGKWHLGIGGETGKQNWNGKIDPSLDSIGFDYSFIMAATGDRVPCVYIEQGVVADYDPSEPIQVSYRKPFEGEPLGSTHPELLRILPSHGHNQAIVDSIPRIGYMKGGGKALWKDEMIADRITEKALNFMDRNANEPFFLYFATNDIHVPRVPHWRFKGKSGMGERGDAILEFDWSVGQILEKVEELGIADNTLIILSSDNGAVLDDGYVDGAVELLGDHDPTCGLRGGKYSAFEGGTRVPMIVSWKGVVPKGKKVDNRFSQVDYFASLSSLIGVSMNSGLDSEDHLSLMLSGKGKGREVMIQDGFTRAIVVGDWKYIKPSGGAKTAWQTGIETACSPEPQLYNLRKDPFETTNIASENPEKVKELAELLKLIETQN